MVQLGDISRKDNGNMRSVAVVGLVYLPATFVSSLFRMNFFQFFGESGDETREVSDKFWMYWAITIPLAMTTVLVWTRAFHMDGIKRGMKILRTLGRRVTQSLYIIYYRRDSE